MSSSSSFYSENVLKHSTPQIRVYVCVTGSSHMVVRGDSEDREDIETIRAVFAKKSLADQWEHYMDKFIELKQKYYVPHSWSYIQEKDRKAQDIREDKAFLSKFCRWLGFDFEDFDDPDMDIVFEGLTCYKDSPIEIEYDDEYAAVKEFQVE